MQLDLGNKIRQLRRRDKRTQESLAEALGVTAQAVSRWESGGSYPDMNLIPSIANYFGISIDELFGYHNDRDRRIEALVTQIQKMKWKNNGVDTTISQTISFARNALVEYPGNERLMVCLASVLFTAGYSRYGEYHLTDADGFDIYDFQRHRGYEEWCEAVTLYEKALPALKEDDFRCVAVGELIQLYANLGMHEKACALADSAPSIYSTREYMRISACDGRERVIAHGQAILGMLHAGAVLMIQTVLASKETMSVAEKIQSIQGAIGLFDIVCPDGNYGEHNRLLSRMHTFLSLYLWLDGRRDEAFAALDRSLYHFRQFEQLCFLDNPGYTAPLVRCVKVDFSRSTLVDPSEPATTAASLYMDWPWWNVPEADRVKREMQDDPRWEEWIFACDHG